MNARRAREHHEAERRRIEAALAAADAAPAEFVAAVGEGAEAWRRAGVLFVVPTIPDDAPVPLKGALGLRRAATLTGRCFCGGERAFVERRLVVEHSTDCAAGDDVLDRVAAECGYAIGRWSA